jgi:hypothetical protein
MDSLNINKCSRKVFNYVIPSKVPFCEVHSQKGENTNRNILCYSDDETRRTVYDLPLFAHYIHLKKSCYLL